MKLSRVYFYNRWRQRKYSRPSDWVFIGVSTRWASPDDMCYRLSFFGFEISFWFEK